GDHVQIRCDEWFLLVVRFLLDHTCLPLHVGVALHTE
ncbi:hypothetical protein D049_2591B, partial [Vibrio parahaemolyticus VPTS-2010]